MYCQKSSERLLENDTKVVGKKAQNSAGKGTNKCKKPKHKSNETKNNAKNAKHDRQIMEQGTQVRHNLIRKKEHAVLETAYKRVPWNKILK